MNKIEILLSLLQELQSYMEEASGLIEVVSKGMLDDTLIEKLLTIVSGKILLVSDEEAIKKLASLQDTLLAIREQEKAEKNREYFEASRILHSFE